MLLLTAKVQHEHFSCAPRKYFRLTAWGKPASLSAISTAFSVGRISRRFYRECDDFACSVHSRSVWWYSALLYGSWHDLKLFWTTKTVFSPNCSKKEPLKVLRLLQPTHPYLYTFLLKRAAWWQGKRISLHQTPQYIQLL